MHTILKHLLSALSVGIILVADPAHGAAVLIGNHSFETTNIAAGASQAAAGSPWLRRTSGTDFTIGLIDRNSNTPNSFTTRIDPTPDATDAEQMLYLNSVNESVYQVLSATLLANTTYTMTVDAGDRTDLTFASSQLRLGYVPGTDTGVGGDSVANYFFGEFLLTPTVVANTTPVNGAGANDGWRTWITTFTTGASPAGLGMPLRVEIVGSGTQSLFDNVRLDAIPEPSSAMLFVLGLMGLCGVRNRKR